MTTGEDGQPHHRVFVDPDQAPVWRTPQLSWRCWRTERAFSSGSLLQYNGGALALGETLLAGAAGEDSALFVGPISRSKFAGCRGRVGRGRGNRGSGSSRFSGHP